ncbi:MAG TPA: archaemetzincin family Zn-dependent metalloprotease [Thermoanaerobaculia bacterium]|nr:archaemetzincin family Zn-dependent metalloprotease [Thermoanaerobaculia bacterium]
MKPIRLVTVGSVEPRMLDAARRALSIELGTSCIAVPRELDPAFAFHSERSQYHSTEILEQIARTASDAEICVGITGVDLYIPILTFVFGEAQLGGSCAVVSYHRLLQQFYGLPPDDELAVERLEKEAVHETGHVLGLTHCDDYACVMAASHSVEWLDIKGTALCEECRGKVEIVSS